MTRLFYPHLEYVNEAFGRLAERPQAACWLIVGTGGGIFWSSGLQPPTQAARAELVKAQAKAEAAAAEALRTDERVTQAEADRDTARKESSAAREEAAKLAGKLEATQAQMAELMRVIAERQARPEAAESTPSTAPKAVTAGAKTAQKS